MSYMQTFDDSLARNRRGVAIAWIANFGVLWITLTSFIFLSFSYIISIDTVADIGWQLAWCGVFSVVITWIILLGAVFFADKSISLLVRADKDSRCESGKLFNIVEEVALSAGMDYVPEVHLLKGTGVPNAYAVDSPFRSKKQAKVYITQELYESLTREEIKAVMSHEIAHIINRDSKAMTHIIAVGVVVTLVSIILRRYGFYFIKKNSNKIRGPVIIVVIVIIAIMWCIVIFSPAIAKLTQALMSRRREELADSTGVSLCRNPTALATALVTIDTMHNKHDISSKSRLYQAVGSLALYSPLGEGLKKRLSTHPPMDVRIGQLVAIGADEKTIEQRYAKFKETVLDQEHIDDDIIF